MCGIVGAIAQRDVAQDLIEGLKRLEYRGYDSAGVAILNEDHQLQRARVTGKVAKLSEKLSEQPLHGNIGVAHTRWATHGKPSEVNAHPLISQDDIALVHNGIIENHEELRAFLQGKGYEFLSETDSEIIVHLIHYFMRDSKDFLHAVQSTVKELKGAYSLGILYKQNKEQFIGVRRGSPLVVGLGENEKFIASDPLALTNIVSKFIYLQDGDIVVVSRDKVVVYDEQDKEVERPISQPSIQFDISDKAGYRHFMLKEIFAQPEALAATMEGRLSHDKVLEQAFGTNASTLFDQVKRIHIVACGTSSHAGMIAHYWFESLAGIPAQLEIASEYRYRDVVVEPGTLFVCISQSGETADTFAALQKAKTLNYISTLAISNVAESSIVREAELVFLTRAGIEIGVASTKAFTTQLVALLMLVAVLGRRNKLTNEKEADLVEQLRSLPRLITSLLNLDEEIKHLSEEFADKHHALFLGRGVHYPVALEGALKLKEISYIHAEAYPAGELKHGPLALVDADMPVVAVAPNDELLEKLKSNLQEVKARGGLLFVFADESLPFKNSEGVTIIKVPMADKIIAPIAYTVPLQLLAYYAAVLKGTDIDQPRNLAKSVTVE